MKVSRVTRASGYFTRTPCAQFIRLGTVAALSLCVGCSGDAGLYPDVTFSVFEGDGLNAIAGDPVTTRPAVRVTEHGAGRPGVPVKFWVTSGGGSLTGQEQQTDADGIARVGSWTLGRAVGANTMISSVFGRKGTVTFTVQGIARPVTSLTRIPGDGQPATATGAAQGTSHRQSATHNSHLTTARRH